MEEENGWEIAERHGTSFKDHEAGQSIIYLMIQEILEMDEINEDRVFYVRKQVIGILVSHSNMLSSYLTGCDATNGFSKERRQKVALECKLLCGKF